MREVVVLPSQTVIVLSHCLVRAVLPALIVWLTQAISTEMEKDSCQRLTPAQNVSVRYVIYLVQFLSSYPLLKANRNRACRYTYFELRWVFGVK